MRGRRIAALVSTAVVVSGLTVGLVAVPGGAQIPAEFTVEKVVDGEGTPAPGTEFVVTAVCTGENPETFEITFDAEGTPVAENSFDSGSFTGSCTFTETTTGGASSVSYACEVNEPPATCSGGGADPVTIEFERQSDLLGTVTVTNTFDPPPPPEPVVVVPAFTG